MDATRRAIIGACAIGLPVAACSTGTPPPLSQIATDVNLIAAGLSTVVAALTTAPNIPAKIIAQVQQYLTVIQADAKQIAVATALPSANTITEIVNAVQAIASVAGSIPALVPYAPFIQAAVALLPGLIAMAGASGTITIQGPVMSPAIARATLAPTMHP